MNTPIETTSQNYAIFDLIQWEYGSEGLDAIVKFTAIERFDCQSSLY